MPGFRNKELPELNLEKNGSLRRHGVQHFYVQKPNRTLLKKYMVIEDFYKISTCLCLPP